MKPEQAESFFIEELFSQSQEKGSCSGEKLELVDKLTGDASTRRYYRIFTDKQSYVVCLDNPTTEANSKNTFVANQKFLAAAGVRVPRILDTNLNKGYILEEDLGDVTLLAHLATIKDNKEEHAIYHKVISQLLDLHKLPIDKVNQSKLFELKFDLQKFMDEMDFTFKFFFKSFLRYDDEVQTARVRQMFQQVCQRLATQKMVLTHRDFHSRNVMVKAGEYIFIDFQDARLGIPQYDLVSMLEDCYYELSPANRESIKRYYYDHLPLDVHQQGSYENFCQLYNDMALQRVFKAVGSFSYIYATRKDERYLKYIGFAMEKLRRIMMEDSRYTELRQLLYDIYYTH